jgi:hypothetical protein
MHLLVQGSGEAVCKFAQYSLSQSSVRIRSLMEACALKGDRLASNYLALMRSRGNGTASAKVWKERFRIVPLEREEAILVKLDYIHNNPVRRGLVGRPEDWHWSSFGAYHDGQAPLCVDLPIIR